MKLIQWPSLISGLLFIGLGVWAFAGSHTYWGSAAMFVGACAALDSLQWVFGNWRSRPWGAPMSLHERHAFGSRLVFEPKCLHADCDGPVVDLINGQVPRKIRPITGPPFDPQVPHFYTQGAATCRRCRRKYSYSTYQGGLSVSSMDGRLRGSVPPVETA